jgi:5,10-methenyltetrahydromethanopterin hydrogenase
MARTVILLCLTLILFINTCSSVKIDDEDFDEDGILIDDEEYDSVDEEEDDDDEEEDHSMPDLTEWVGENKDEYPGPPKFP